MRWTGFSPERVARTCLDTLDRGGLYCMPQPDARIGWGIKRFTPTVYTRAVGLTARVGLDTLGGSSMAIDMDAMLAKIKDRQWALADIDWDAPGAETISDEFRPKLKAFMADLCWIENIGARGFAALAKKAPTPTIAEIYRYFHAEEQRHANAELALMKRWGMLDDGEMPEPNVNIRLAIEWLDRYSDDMSLSILGTVIPMLEVALDGALLKFLLDEVDDPVCHQVFEKINNDESRHIAVDFEVLEHDRRRQGAQAGRRVRRQRRLARAHHRRDHVRAAAQPDAQQHRRHGHGTRAAVQGDEAVQGTRRARRIHLAGADLSGAQTARARWWSTRATPTTCWPTRWSGLSDRYPQAAAAPDSHAGSRNSPTSRRPEPWQCPSTSTTP